MFFIESTEGICNYGSWNFTPCEETDYAILRQWGWRKARLPEIGDNRNLAIASHGYPQPSGRDLQVIWRVQTPMTSWTSVLSFWPLTSDTRLYALRIDLHTWSWMINLVHSCHISPPVFKSLLRRHKYSLHVSLLSMLSICSSILWQERRKCSGLTRVLTHDLWTKARCSNIYAALSLTIDPGRDHEIAPWMHCHYSFWNMTRFGWIIRLYVYAIASWACTLSQGMF